MSDAEPQATPPLTILHRDDRLLAVAKPSGMLVHRGWAADEAVLVDLLRAQLDGADLFPLHRLDRGTSGVLCLALDKEAAAFVGQQFEAHAPPLTKTYLALVRGLAPEAVDVDHGLRPHDSKTGKRRKAADALPRLPAQTRFERIEARQIGERSYSLVKALPRTGRTHQIRRHLKHLAHPIIGDVRYGKGNQNRYFRAHFDFHRMALHAAALTLEHPDGGALELRAPVPADLREPLRAMGFETLRTW